MLNVGDGLLDLPHQQLFSPSMSGLQLPRVSGRAGLMWDAPGLRVSHASSRSLQIDYIDLDYIGFYDGRKTFIYHIHYLHVKKKHVCVLYLLDIL